jgi:hypothetical protein
MSLYLTPAWKLVITGMVSTLQHDHACRQDLIMAALYTLAAVVVIYWHHRIWVVYAMAAVAYAYAMIEALGVM